MIHRKRIPIALCRAIIACATTFTTAVAQVADAPPPYIRVVRVEPAEPWESYRQTFAPGPPLLRGFRFPTLDHPQDLWPVKPPSPDAPEPLRRATDIVTQRLAKDGLLSTLAQVIQTLGTTNFVSDSQLPTLRSVGLPVDWLEYFHLDGPSPGADGIVREIARRLTTAESSAQPKGQLTAARFAFLPSRPGFQLSPESGETPIAHVRLQSPTADDHRGPGDGGCIDIIRQLVAAWPDSDFTLSVEQKDLPALMAKAQTWSLKRPAQLTLLAVPWPIEQWAQDNAKPGHIPDAGGKAKPALLIPRYANRGEERTVLDPNASLAVRSLGAAGLTIVASPLIFQGGNLLPVLNPADGKTLLLIGEAEIYRNTALGLARDQVLEAFRLECGVDRCLVLPAVSFHLDFELSIRAHNGSLTAFVNDEPAAARIILHLGADILARLGTIDADTLRQAHDALAAKNDRRVVELLSGPSNRLANKDGYFPADVAVAFAAGPVDHGPANLQRYLLALDILASLAATPDDLPPDALTRAYITALQRRRADRADLHRQLTDLGWRIAPVPSLADEDRSINYLNGFHEPGRYVMPAWGGLYAPLDAAAAKAIRDALGGSVQVAPIFSADSQRRLGAIHCTASVWPTAQR